MCECGCAVRSTVPCTTSYEYRMLKRTAIPCRNECLADAAVQAEVPPMAAKQPPRLGNALSLVRAQSTTPRPPACGGNDWVAMHPDAHDVLLQFP